MKNEKYVNIFNPGTGEVQRVLSENYLSDMFAKKQHDHDYSEIINTINTGKLLLTKTIYFA